MEKFSLMSKLAEDNKIDFEDFYRIKADPDNIKWSGFLSAPEKNTFRNWFSEQIKKDDREIYLVYLENEPHAVAFFYIDYFENKKFYTASGVLGSFTRRGIGTWMMQESDRIAFKKGYNTHLVIVSEFNIGSAKRFEKLGYEKTSEFEIRNVPLAGGEQKFYKWKKNI